MSRVSSSSFLRSLTSRISASTRRPPSRGAFGARRQFDPDGRAVGAAQAEQVVADGAVGAQAIEERDARLRIDEAIVVERADLGFGRFAGVAEDQFQVRVGGDRRGPLGADRADVHAFEDGVEEPCERCRATFHAWDYTEIGLGFVSRTHDARTQSNCSTRRGWSSVSSGVRTVPGAIAHRASKRCRRCFMARSSATVIAGARCWWPC